MKKADYLTMYAVLMGASCSGPGSELTDATRAAIAHSVDSATNAFADAERARDPERVLAHVSPDFYMYNDGVRVGYDAIVAQIRETFPALQEFATTWDAIEVTVLGRDHAMVSFVFRDEVTLATGSTLRVRGPTTLVWRRNGVDWQIIYADADHYPDSLP